jgi:hypothetical protein
MQTLLESSTINLQEQARKIRLQYEAEQLIQGREFSFVLFSENSLKHLFEPYLPA